MRSRGGSPPYIFSPWVSQVLQWNEALAFGDQNRPRESPGEPKEKPAGSPARVTQESQDQHRPFSWFGGWEPTIGSGPLAGKSGSQGHSSQPVRLRHCPLEMDSWGLPHPWQGFSALSNLLAKTREAWSSSVCFILCITRSYHEGASPNEAKQQAILNTLKQSLPL